MKMLSTNLELIHTSKLTEKPVSTNQKEELVLNNNNNNIIQTNKNQTRYEMRWV